MTISKIKFNEAFSLNCERERIRLGLSQEEMARKLELSLSAYKRIINGETQKVDIYICYLGYMLTQKFLFEMVDYSDEYVDVFRKIHGLTDQQITILNQLIDIFLEE